MKSFSERAGRVAEIILDRKCKDKKIKTKKIGRETVSMIQEVKRVAIVRAAYGVGRLSRLTKRVYRNLYDHFKEAGKPLVVRGKRRKKGGAG